MQGARQSKNRSEMSIRAIKVDTNCATLRDALGQRVSTRWQHGPLLTPMAIFITPSPVSNQLTRLAKGQMAAESCPCTAQFMSNTARHCDRWIDRCGARSAWRRTDDEHMAQLNLPVLLLINSPSDTICHFARSGELDHDQYARVARAGTVPSESLINSLTRQNKLKSDQQRAAHYTSGGGKKEANVRQGWIN